MVLSEQGQGWPFEGFPRGGGHNSFEILASDSEDGADSEDDFEGMEAFLSLDACSECSACSFSGLKLDEAADNETQDCSTLDEVHMSKMTDGILDDWGLGEELLTEEEASSFLLYGKSFSYYDSELYGELFFKDLGEDWGFGFPDDFGDEPFDEEEELIINQFCGVFPRGGALGASSTSKKRLHQLVELIKTWGDNAEEEEDSSEIQQLVATLQEKIMQWSKKLPSKQEVCETLGDLVQKASAEGSQEKEGKGAKGSSGKGTSLHQQSFYEALLKRSSVDGAAVAGGKNNGKNRGKGKGKKPPALELPSFDLKRAFPARSISTWQSALASLERGEEPKGHVCICKDTSQILHFIDLASAGGVASSFTLVASFVEGNPINQQGLVTLLPFLGNLALKKAFVACLDGSKPTVNFEPPSKVELKTVQTQPMTSLRINIALSFVESKAKQVLLEYPSMALHYTGAKKFLT